MSNELLAIGKISGCVKEDRSIEIAPCEGEELPSAKYETKVKVNVFSGSQGFVSLYGFVYIAHNTFWRLSDVDCFGQNERRSNFRVRIRSKAEVEAITEEEQPEGAGQEGAAQQAVKYSCLITSVSISGLLFAVDDETCNYDIGSKLLIHNFRIGDSIQMFSLKCCVKRTDTHERLGKLFGCKFYDLKDREVEALCQAIFAQQRVEIQRGRGIF